MCNFSLKTFWSRLILNKAVCLFQSKAASAGISRCTTISNLFCRSSYLSPSFYMTKNLKHFSSDNPGSPSARQSSAESDSDESTEVSEYFKHP